MTTITVYTRGDALQGFEAGGHAGAKRIRGYDLVCCAVSALTQTGVNALCEVAGIMPDVEVRDGYLKCILPEGEDSEKAQTVLRTIMTGLTDIQKIYPNLIRIQQKEWRQADAYDESSALRA